MFRSAIAVYLFNDYTGILYGDDNICYYKNGCLHREDGPALTHNDGDSYWYRNGKLHRDDGPAVIQSNGTKIWYMNGLMHNRFGPAIIYDNGTVVFYLNNKSVHSASEFQAKARISSEQMSILILTYGEVW